MSESGLNAVAAKQRLRDRLGFIGAFTVVGVLAGGVLSFASAIYDRGYGWVPTMSQAGFACVGSVVGGIVGAALAARWLRWRIALAAVGALAGSIGPLSFCDGTVLLAPALGAIFGAALGLVVEKTAT
ncbi:MAG TPA: hypothetical protein VMV10_18190 [Pirellulales bacterium]|nr:hypothetical protein [Pirellulales bacterium]